MASTVNKVSWGCTASRCLNFRHHRLVNGQASSRINNDGVVSFRFSMRHGIAGNFHSIFIARFCVHIHTDAFAQYGELVHGCRSVYITGH